MWGVGFADDDGHYYGLGSWCEDAVSRTDTVNWEGSTGIIAFVGSGSISGLATFSGFITNGCQIYWSNAPSQAHLITAVFFAGTDVASEIFYGDFTDTNSPVTVTTGFEPDVLIGLNAEIYDNNSTSGDAQFNVGMAVRGGDQYAAFWDESDNAADGAMYHEIRDSGFLTDTIGKTASVSQYNSTNFVVTIPGSESVNERTGLALQIGTLSMAVDVIDTPTSTGTQAYTQPGFTPQFALIVGTYATALDTNTNLGAGCMGVADSTSGNEYSISWQSEYGAATSNTSCLTDGKIINMPTDAGGTGIVATVSTWDTNGLTLNYSATDTGTVRKLILLTIQEEGPPPDVSVPVLSNHQYRRRYV